MGWLKRHAIAAVCVGLAVSAVLAVPTAVNSWNNTTSPFNEAESSDYYASDNEFLNANFASGMPVRVHGKGKISTQNTQSWTVWAADGCEHRGTITGAELPYWRVHIGWYKYLYAVARSQSGSSNHRANVGCWAVVQGDISGNNGYEYDLYYQHPSSEETYSVNYSVNGVNYSHYGKRKYEGAYEQLPVSDQIAIHYVTVGGASINFRLATRGWMTLQSNTHTLIAETILNQHASGDESRGKFRGVYEAWDAGPSPDLLIEVFDVD